MESNGTSLLQDIMTNMSFDNPNFMSVMIPVGIGFTFGFLIYIYAVAILIKEKKSCYPVMVHTFFMAFDGFGAVFWGILAFRYDFFWFFCLYAVSLLVWVFLEIWCLMRAVKYERKELFGKYFNGDATVKQCVSIISVQVIFFLGMVVLYNYCMGGLEEASMMKFYVWSICLPVIAVAGYWKTLETREGTSMGLAITLLLSIVAGFLPNGFGMYTALSPFFDVPQFYFAGVIVICVAIYNVFTVKNKSPKPLPANGSKPIW